jgi:hypothetical protein
METATLEAAVAVDIAVVEVAVVEVTVVVAAVEKAAIVVSGGSLGFRAFELAIMFGGSTFDLAASLTWPVLSARLNCGMDRGKILTGVFSSDSSI